MSRLRVLHITPYYEDAWAYGGIPRVVPILAQGLAERGHEVTVCTTDVLDETSRLPANRHRAQGRSEYDSATSLPHGNGVEIRIFANLSNFAAYHLQLFLPLGMATFLSRHAASFDVAHIHACRNLPGVLAARYLRRWGVPYLIAPHGTAPRIERRHVMKWLFDISLGRRYLARAHRVLAVSEAEERQLIQLGMDASRIRLLANPICLDPQGHPKVPPRGRFRSRHGIDQGPMVLYLGRLSPRKRLDVLVRAFAQLGLAEAHLVIAGNDMGVAPSLRRLVHRLGLGSRTLMPGLLGQHERLEALADADLVVYPGEHEIFGLVPMEALLCGTPVLVADDSGCGEIVLRTGGGRVTAAGDHEALARSMRDLLAQAGTARRAAVAAGERVCTLFAKQTICHELEKIYMEMLAPQSAQGERL